MKRLSINGSVVPGEVWLDSSGEVIQAHGGGMLYHEGIYYWYGEHKGGETKEGRCDVVGVSCYSSADLLHWNNEGMVLQAVPDDPGHDLHPGKVLERPKVLYNRAARTFVMWMHVDTADYSLARAGVAVSGSPVGPFRYLESFRPGGAMSRDMTVFQDSDAKAYLLCSSEHNSTLYVFELTEDYVATTGRYTRHFINGYREAPAIFKDGGNYYLITSDCTGWEANEAEYAVADKITGPWTIKGNPCCGPGAEKTFNSQGTFVVPVQGMPGGYIFMADRWNGEDLADSRYVWLPLRVEKERISIVWKDEWTLDELRQGGEEK